MAEPPPQDEFTPISPNPYIVGNPVRGRAMFFGREAEFELVRKRFQDSSHGGLLVFCGERRSGKTSILFQILDQRLGPDFIPVLVDMQSMAVGSEVEFLTRLSEEVIAALGPEAEGIARPRFTEGSNHSATFQKFVREVLKVHPHKRLILLFDEYELFETKIDSGQLAEDVLHVLASLMESQPVFLIFTGSQHLEQRRREYWNILGKSLYKTISFLEREDALNLVRKPVEGRVRFAEGTVEAIYRLTAGQPFYTQAVCQSLVDHLNEGRTRVATPAMVSEVVDGIINNPLPQMIFLWDGLERDEKLALALLAETLADGDAYARDDDLRRLLRRRGYPLDLDKARVATALENLFKGEMLLRRDRTSEPEYAFRMDLWRLWIRRQHSVWQVMRELGLEIRRGLRSRTAFWVIRGGAAVAAVVLAIVMFRGRSEEKQAPVATESFTLEAEPEEAMIHLDGRRVAMGTFRDAIAAGQDHRFRLTAAGYADSEFVIRLRAGHADSERVRLRALLGDLRIETRPSGAEVKVDGRPVGRSPVTASGLLASARHGVEVSLEGFGTIRQEFAVQPNTVSPVAITLQQGRADVVVTSEPSGSEIRVDNRGRGVSPVPLPGISIGQHTITAAREGYVAAETTLAISSSTRQVHLTLRRQPPGVLVIQGDRPAQMYIDGALVVENVQNSGPRQLAGGTHQVRVVLVSGEMIDSSVVVRPRERTIYDYSRGTVTRRPEGER